MPDQELDPVESNGDDSPLDAAVDPAPAPPLPEEGSGAPDVVDDEEWEEADADELIELNPATVQEAGVAVLRVRRRRQQKMDAAELRLQGRRAKCKGIADIACCISVFILAIFGSPRTHCFADDPKTNKVLSPFRPTELSDQQLLRYIADEAGVAHSRAELRKRILELNSPAYSEREDATASLTKCGIAVLPALRDAQAGVGAEGRKRLAAVIERIQRGWDYRRVVALRAAVSEVIRRKPRDMTPCLLTALALLDGDDLANEVQEVLDAKATHQGRVEDGMEVGANNCSACVRAFCGYLLARRGDARQREAAKVLLTDDSTLVRLRTAQGFLGAGDQSAIPVLISLLDQRPTTVAWQAEELLRFAAGEATSLRMPIVDEGRENLAECRAAWEAWWRNEHERYDFAKATRDSGPPVLIFVQCSGFGYLLGGDGRFRWNGSRSQATVHARLRTSKKFVAFSDSGLALTWRLLPMPIRPAPNQPTEYELAEEDLSGTTIRTLGRWLDHNDAVSIRVAVKPIAAGHSVINVTRILPLSKESQERMREVERDVPRPTVGLFADVALPVFTYSSVVGDFATVTIGLTTWGGGAYTTSTTKSSTVYSFDVWV